MAHATAFSKLVPLGPDFYDESRPPESWAPLTPGARILGATVVRALHKGKDTNVYLFVRDDGAFSALKLERVSHRSESAYAIRARLAHEAAFLAHLDSVREAHIAVTDMRQEFSRAPLAVPMVRQIGTANLTRSRLPEAEVARPARQLAPKLLAKGELDGRSYLELEFISGVDAATAAAGWRERGGANERVEFLRMVQAIAQTYARLHERGVLHGNVHPDNVLIRRDGTAVLLDFSLARPAVAQTALPTPSERGGTPFFFEPEMACVALAGLPSMPVSAQGEQHAVAALIYFLLTGAHWQNLRLGQNAMLEDIATLHPLSFRDRGVEPWPEMEAVLGRALSKLPQARFPSMTAFAAALDAVTVPMSDRITNSVSPSEALSGLLKRALANAGPPRRSPEIHVACITDIPARLVFQLRE